jgi:hypothetical protein
MSSQAPATATSANMGQDVKPAGQAAANVKVSCSLTFIEKIDFDNR